MTNKIFAAIFCLAVVLFQSGCTFAVITATTTLAEPPFATQQMKGDVTQATRCVGRYWQKAASDLGSFWEVRTDSYQVLVTGQHGAGTPPVGLVIVFEQENSVTIASAHVHSVYPENNPRRWVTIDALEACGI